MIYLESGLWGVWSQHADLESSHYTTGHPNFCEAFYGNNFPHVMGHYWAAGWLERPERRVGAGADLLIARLSLSEDFVVADIGAGTGYSLLQRERVPEGKK